MEIEIASPNEKEKMMMKQYQAQVAPVAPPEKGMGGQMMDMAKQRAMEGALNTGQSALMGAIPSAGAANAAALAANPATMGMAGPSLGAVAGGTGAMTALGTAVPYVGAGLLAGKALGLFSHGGHIGPLSVMYNSEGTKPDYLDLDEDKNTSEPMAKAAKDAKEKKPQYNAEGNTVPMPMMMMEVPMPMMKPNIMGMKYLQENPQDAAMSLEGYDPILIDPLAISNEYKSPLGE